ncbi:MAG: hypothetical protein ABI333_21620 [bacterium]
MLLGVESVGALPARTVPEALRLQLGPAESVLFPSGCGKAPIGFGRCPVGAPVACPLRLWLGCGSLFGLQSFFALSPTSAPARLFDKTVRTFARKSINPFTGELDDDLVMLTRFVSELSMGITLRARSFRDSLVDTFDKNHAVLGQFQVTYRRALFSKPSNAVQRRMAWVLHVYKEGVDTPLLRQLFTGGWLALEINAFPYTDRRERRLLFRMVSAGGHVEKAKDYVTQEAKSAFFLNGGASIEAAWRMGSVTAILRSAAHPRYNRQVWVVRVRSELALQIRILGEALDRSWLSEVTLVPKLIHNYHSAPLIEEIQGPELAAALKQQLRFQVPDLRHIVTFYCNVEFRMKMY